MATHAYRKSQDHEQELPTLETEEGFGFEAEMGNAARQSSLGLGGSTAAAPVDEPEAGFEDPMVAAILGDLLSQEPPPADEDAETGMVDSGAFSGGSGDTGGGAAGGGAGAPADAGDATGGLAQAPEAAAVIPPEDGEAIGALQWVMESPPSVQVEHWTGMAESFNPLSAAETAGATLSPLPVLLAGEEQGAAVDGEQRAPESQAFAVEDGSSAPEVTVDREGAGAVSDAAVQAPELAAQADSGAELSAAVSGLPEREGGLSTSPGAEPRHQLVDGADPAKLSADLGGAVSDAEAQRQEAARLTIEGTRTDQLRGGVVDEELEVSDALPAQLAETAAVPGMEQLQALELDGDALMLFDAREGARFQEGLAGARSALDQASLEHDDLRLQAMEGAHAQSLALSGDAQLEQQALIAEQRGELVAARDQTLQSQEQAVEALRQDMGAEAQRARGDIRARVDADSASVHKLYADAEKQAEVKVAEGEAKAAKEKQAAEEDDSWISMALDAAKRAFEAVQSTIGDIFQAVRDAVGAILDAARAGAEWIIRAGQAFVEGAVSAFGELLTRAVGALLAERFPALAKSLNDTVHAIVDVVCAGVTQIADALRDGVATVAKGLEGALDAAARGFEAAVSTALAAAQAVATGDWDQIGAQLLQAIASAAGIDPKELLSFIGQGEATLMTILADPGAFLGNLLEAGWGGIKRFGSNFLQHLQSGLLGWLTGAMGGVVLPERLDLAGVFSLVTQLIGLGTDRLWAIAGKVLGEENAERLQGSVPMLETLFSGGPMALLDQLKDSIGDLGGTVLAAIEELLLEKVVFAAVTKLGSMFTPVGAVVQAVVTAWNMFEFVRDRMADLMGLAQGILSTVSDIAKGSISKAQEGVERVLADGLPVALDMLARILGLGGLGGKVRGVIQGIGDKVEGAIEKLVKRLGGGRKKTGNKRGEEKNGGAKKGGGTKSNKGEQGAEKDGSVVGPVRFTAADGAPHKVFFRGKRLMVHSKEEEARRSLQPGGQFEGVDDKGAAQRKIDAVEKKGPKEATESDLRGVADELADGVKQPPAEAAHLVGMSLPVSVDGRPGEVSVGQFLGSGARTWVFSGDFEGREVAVRVARTDAPDGVQEMQAFINGRHPAWGKQLPLIELMASSENVAVVEKLDFNQSFATVGDMFEALQAAEQRGEDVDRFVAKSRLLDKYNGLFEFVRKTANFKKIGDFSPYHITWGAQGWVVFDYSANHVEGDGVRPWKRIRKMIDKKTYSRIRSAVAQANANSAATEDAPLSQETVRFTDANGDTHSLYFKDGKLMVHSREERVRDAVKPGGQFDQIKDSSPVVKAVGEAERALAEESPSGAKQAMEAAGRELRGGPAKPKTDGAQGAKQADDLKDSGPPHDKVPENRNQSERYIRELGSSWSRVKKAYANKDREPVMRKLLDFRQKDVDKRIDDVCKKLGSVTAKAFGSTDLTSDYDLSFFGKNEVPAVELFNKEFRAYWGREAGVVFDTNVYTAGEFLPEVSETQQVTEKSKAGTEDSQEADDAAQDVASLVHTRRYMKDDEWKRFRGRLEGDLSGKARAQMSRRLDDAEARYARFQREMKERMDSLRKQRDEEEQVYTSKIKTAKLGGAADDKIAGEDLELQASNQLYSEKLGKLDAVRKRRDALLIRKRKGQIREEEVEQLEALIVEVRELQAEALQYANESYFSDGAVRHVVGNLQANWGLDMSVQQLLSSFNEQLACVLKDLATYSRVDLDDWQKLGKAAFRSSKYIDRMCKAGRELARAVGAGASRQLAILEEVSGELLRIRKSRDQYKTFSDSEKNFAGVEVLTEQFTKVGSIEDLRAFIVKVGADVNAQYRAKAARRSDRSGSDVGSKKGK